MVGLGEGPTKAGNPLIPTSPPVAAAALICASLILRGQGNTAAELACENTNGRVEASIASSVVLSPVCEPSTMMRISFNRCTRSRPKRERPALPASSQPSPTRLRML